jgi:hypothetical protein
MFLKVQDIRVLTDSTDSMVSLAVGEVLVRIWNAIVSKDPPSVLFSSCLEVITRGLDSSPSGRIENPEGNMAMLLASHPVMTDCMPVMSTGAYTTMDSYALVQLS